MKRVMLGILLVAASGIASETKVTEKDVPRAALDAVAKKYPKAKKVGCEKEIEHGQTSYEVKLVEGARHIDVDVSPDGKILAEEELVAKKDLPTTARNALALSPKYGSWTVKRVERVIKNENAAAPMYEFVVAHDQEKAEVLIGSDGTIVSVESSDGNELR